ncbi:MAG: acetolactate synthase small subunit [Deltaproteobacteria bacterium]
MSILVENKFGVLARVAGLFSARGYNIDSLTVSETEDPSVSRMTVVVHAQDERILEQIKKQLHKLIDVITVQDFLRKEVIDRELVFVRIEADKKKQAGLSRLVRRYAGVIVEKKPSYVIVEIAAGQKDVQRFLEDVKGFKILELVRSGCIAMAK